MPVFSFKKSPYKLKNIDNRNHLEHSRLAEDIVKFETSRVRSLVGSRIEDNFYDLQKRLLMVGKPPQFPTNTMLFPHYSKKGS
jgi:hypothetical protein